MGWFFKALFFFSSSAWLSWFLMIQSSYVSLFAHICKSVSHTYYDRQNKNFRPWLDECLRKSKIPPSFFLSRQQMLDSLVYQANRHFSALGVSHLFLSPPTQSNELLFHKVTDTGLRGRFIEGQLIITQILPSSTASQTNIQLGDEVLGINGYEPRNPEEVRHSGVFTLQRGEQIFEVGILGRELHLDQRPKVYPLDHHTGVLRIPSFEGQYRGKSLFDSEYWKTQIHKLHQFASIIIDLRGNYGGNFAAMLRGVSAFFCKPTLLGSIQQPKRKDLQIKSYFPDVLDGPSQLEILHNYREIELITYDGYNCYSGPVVVLIDADTASVAEIFAASFRLRNRSIIAGHPTLGNVLVAQREELLRLGTGYVLSVPIASYFSVKDEDLEATGVYPDKIYHYNLQIEQSGRDSWLEMAKTVF